MIRTVEALHYRSLRYVRQDLQRFHVLVGPNASGKTTFFDVIRFLGDLVAGGLDAAIAERTDNLRDLFWLRQGGRFELAVEIDVPDAHGGTRTYDGCRYEIAIGIDPESQENAILAERVLLFHFARGTAPRERTLFPERLLAPETVLTPRNARGVRTLVNKGHNGNDTFYDETGKGWDHAFRLGRRRSALGNLPEDESKFPVATHLKRLLNEGPQSLVLNSALMRRASPPGQATAFRPDGANLPWVVEDLRRRDPRRVQAWVAHLRTALPDVGDVPTVERPEDRHRYIVGCYEGSLQAPAWMVSDGTLRLLALTLPAYLPGLRGVYLIEEPENGIHPRAVETMYQSLSSMYGAQVLMATHSPVILSLAQPSDVLCFARTADGSTDIVNGAGHPGPQGLAGRDEPRRALRGWGVGMTLFAPPVRDLVVLVANKNMESTVQGILARPESVPWQVGFDDAPASIVAAMSGKSRTATRASVVLLPTAAYVAATGNLGPDQDGRLVDAGWLPYDLDLLRNGMPHGQRSEAVRRLELQMLAAGWTVEQIVAALAGQPWIQAMRRNIVGWLTADVLRAAAWRAEQNAPAVGGSASLWTPRGRRRTSSDPEDRTGGTGGTQGLRALAEALARRLSDPGFELDEAIAIAVADAADPERLEADLRQAVAEACTRWAAQQPTAPASGGQQPPKDPGTPAGAAPEGADDDEPAAAATGKGRKRRGPPAGATVLSPSEEELRRRLKAPKRSAQRRGANEDSDLVRLSAPVRLGSVWVRHPGLQAIKHAVLRIGDFILRLARATAEYIAQYEEGIVLVHEGPVPTEADGRSHRRNGWVERVSRRLQLHLDRLLEGPKYCGRRAVFREAPAFNGQGDLFHVHHSTHAPCGQRGCRRCAEIVAAMELAEHSERLRMIYGDEPVVVLRCSTRGFGLPAAQAAARKLLATSEVRQAAGGPGVLCGYLCAEPQDGRIGYCLLLVVPSERQEAVTAAVRAAWCRLAPGGTVAPAKLAGLPETTNALEALVVSHVFSDRAILAAAGAHLVSAEVARAAYGIEIGCDPAHPDAGPVRRWVASPGWRGLLPVLDEVPAGAYLDPGSCPECQEAQRTAAAEGVFGDTGSDDAVLSPDGGGGAAGATGTGGSEDERLAAMRRAPDVHEVQVPGTDITVLVGAPCRWDGQALAEPMWWKFDRKPLREIRMPYRGEALAVLVPEHALRRPGAA